MSEFDRSSYVAGESYAICDKCGRQRYHSQLVREWTGLRVCGPAAPSMCLDPRPAQMSPPFIDPHEGMPMKNPRPRAPDQFVGDTEVDPSTF